MQVVKIEARAEIHLYLIGDEHMGTRYHAANEMSKIVKRVKDDPLARWVGMGDKCEFITPSDPRWDAGSIAAWARPDNIGLDQANYYCDIMAPIADKCDGLLWGNHEKDIKKHNHINVQEYICKQLGVRDLGFMAWIHYQLQPTTTQRFPLDVVVTHGAGGAITRGAKMNRLERLMGAFDAQIFGHGHVHDVILHAGNPYLYRSKSGKLKQRRKMGAMTGCYFRTYTQDVESSYGEQRNYPPTIMGTPMFVISPEGEIVVSA